MRIEATPESTPEQSKRRATRYYFGGVVELIHLDSGRMVVALVRALSLYGCFVKTSQGFKLGSKLLLRMSHAGNQFSAKGHVVNHTEVGIGVEFTEIDAGDRSRLEVCLAELARTDQSA